MRPLPRLHAVTDAAVLALPDFPVRAAAIAAAGPAVALHARDRTAPARRLADVTARLLAHAAAPEAAVFVNARPDIAAALGAHGLQLGLADLPAREARTLVERSPTAGTGRIWIGVSIHSEAEAEQALSEGADFLMAGSIYPTATHADAPAAGLGLVRHVVRLGRPVIAIGGITAARAAEIHDAGAWGVAAVTALWRAADPAQAALDLLAPWMNSDG
jgi:thiamine-phosphate pyrophosphorylase